MSKKVLFIILFLVVISGGIGYYFWNKGKETNLMPASLIEVLPTPTPILLNWDDPAYFIFEFPKEATIDAHPENKNDYAQVELKVDSHPGGITVWSKDTTASSLDDFIKQSKIDGALDTTLGGIPAKKYYEDSDKSILSVAVIQFGNLYLVQANLKDKEYWGKVSDILLSSFQFKELPTSALDQSSSSDDSSDSLDSGGDEVIE
ncbi:hypothetical protein A3D77_05465 [Candidatus Gottesmanbacteria bacterium RIFCSPHIGHO2_02_FULL_39_11]|uniref:PsbP C-terminal domain-containing protein n=1 Tax=Candidatus Gottesmanbacteria bacterium RIFCSPHIGHO2_02_FULL_39_11 TaxID=1798382 RepID=A0A1F5ZLH5_9BACT|nr:MAG: hypothetical protein A3D77_05465 [Candidatus Gottesmanbacteria bacterium RIFCSPHIGHO2_02_FULL_39_11]